MSNFFHSNDSCYENMTGFLYEALRPYINSGTEVVIESDLEGFFVV